MASSFILFWSNMSLVSPGSFLYISLSVLGYHHSLLVLCVVYLLLIHSKSCPLLPSGWSRKCVRLWEVLGCSKSAWVTLSSPYLCSSTVFIMKCISSVRMRSAAGVQLDRIVQDQSEYRPVLCPAFVHLPFGTEPWIRVGANSNLNHVCLQTRVSLCSTLSSLYA